MWSSFQSDDLSCDDDLASRDVTSSFQGMMSMRVCPSANQGPSVISGLTHPSLSALVVGVVYAPLALAHPLNLPTDHPPQHTISTLVCLMLPRAYVPFSKFILMRLSTVLNSSLERRSRKARMARVFIEFIPQHDGRFPYFVVVEFTMYTLYKLYYVCINLPLL